MVDTEQSLADAYNLRSNQRAVSEDDKLDLRPKDYVAYRLDPQSRPSNALLDFWMSDGNQRALAYNHLYEIEFNPSEGLKLTFSDHIVTIQGYRFDKLYRGLKRHRVVFIWEAEPQLARLVTDDDAVVTRISIESRQPVE